MDIGKIKSESGIPQTELEKTLEKIDAAAAAAEECLKLADKQINDMMEARGRIARQVQLLWNKRHQVKQDVEVNKLPLNVDRVMRGF